MFARLISLLRGGPHLATTEAATEPVVAPAPPQPTSLLQQFAAEYGVYARLDPTELRDSAAFLTGLGTPTNSLPPTPMQQRFIRISTQLIRSARLVEMASRPPHA